MIYLDYQATTPLAPEAFDAMLPWLREGHANPHSAHAPGRAAKAAVEVARGHVLKLLPTGKFAFTSGATEALNWAIKGTRGTIVTIATEHAAVLDTAAAEAARGRRRYRAFRRAEAAEQRGRSGQQPAVMRVGGYLVNVGDGSAA